MHIMTRAALQLQGWWLNWLPTASGSRHDFPGVDHEGRQTLRLILAKLI